MKKFTLIALVGLLAICTFSSVSHAGPWTLAAGRTYAEVFTRYSYSRECFGSDGNRSRWQEGGNQETVDLEGKIEYGVTNKLNLLLSVPYTWTKWNEDAVIHGGKEELTNEGFKQIEIGAKYRVIEKPFVGSVQLKGFIHTPADTTREPQLTQYGNYIELRGLAGKSFTLAKRPSYVAFESGVKWPFKGFGAKSEYGTTVPIFAEAGFSPTNWLMLKGEIDCSITVPGTGRTKDTYTWRVGPIINLFGKGFGSVDKGSDKGMNLELLYGQTFAGRGDSGIYKPLTWPNSDDRIAMLHEFIVKVSFLF